MAFLDLRQLKQNVGAKIKLTLQSTGIYQQKTFNGQSFNVFVYEVLQDNKPYTLEVSDALNRKLKSLNTGDTFHLSWEEFTSDEGQLRNYWKVDKLKVVSNGVNEFEQKLKDDQAAKAVTQKSQTFENGARFGMIFNNTFDLYKHFDCAWTIDEFVDNFHRVKGFVEACENQPQKPINTRSQVSSQSVDTPVEIKADDLPF
tara:strand:- start:102 stop:704 length:603 start_codon:yes stop_codon:yes gene_type:complete